MLKSPATEWDVIDGESATVPGLFTGYVMILAAIPAISGVLASLVQSTLHIGFGLAHVFLLPLVIAMAAVSYVAQLASVFLLGFLADALAPSFNGEKNQVQAFKLAAYSPTASWVSSILQIIPFIGWLGAIAGGIYSLYTFWIGAPKLMKVPADKATVFNIVLILAWLVVYWLILAVVGGMVTAMFIGSAIATGGFR
jgi:hypothetical protein